jgi:hypothetical protein
MNTTKTLLKAIVLTALMQSLKEQGIEPTPEMTDAVHGFNDDIEALEADGVAELDKPITEVWEPLLAALDTISGAV